MMTDWAMTDRNCPYADLYLVILALLDSDRAESILRRLLVEPDCSDGLRRIAAARLGSVAHEKKFCLLRDGSISVCSFGDPIGYAQWPQSYRRIMELVYNDLVNGPQNALAEAIKLCFGYASANMKERPTLPYGQSEAMAAAIVYFVRTNDPDCESPDPAVFAREHGVTVRRLENALKRLFERKARDLVEELLSSGMLLPKDAPPSEKNERGAGNIIPLGPEKGGDDDDE